MKNAFFINPPKKDGSVNSLPSEFYKNPLNNNSEDFLYSM